MNKLRDKRERRGLTGLSGASVAFLFVCGSARTVMDGELATW